MARLPESRVKSVAALCDAARPFIDHSVTGLKTATQVPAFEVVFPSASNRATRTTRSYTADAIVGAKPLDSWERKQGDCLHCGDALKNGTAVPVAKFKADARYWVFGQFCTAPCALGYIREHSMGPQVQTWTRQMLLSVFQCPSSTLHSAPPRFMLKRYGGPLDKPEFAQLKFCALKAPPLSSFAMFAECHAEQRSKAAAAALATMSLSRPKERDTMPAEQRETGREPLLLRVLAEAAPMKDKTTSDVAMESGEAPAATAPAAAAPSSPKRRRTKSAGTSGRKTTLSEFMN